MYKIFSLLIILLNATQGLCKPKYNETLTIIKDFADQSEKDQEKLSNELEAKFSQTVDPREKMLSAISLGTHYLKLRDFRLAGQYLHLADVLTKKDDVVKPLIKFHLLELSLQNAEYSYVLSSATALLKKTKRLSVNRRKELYHYIIKSLWNLDRHKELTNTFLRYRRRNSSASLPPDLMTMVSKSFHKQGNLTQEIAALEKLAELYPINPESVWAFNKLQEYSCRGKNTYAFSIRLLKKIARRKDLDFGIHSFLVDQSYQQVRNLSGRTKKLTPLERANYLLLLNLNGEALDAVEDLSTELRTHTKHAAETLLTVAKIYDQNLKYDLAARNFSKFIADFPKHFKKNFAEQSLANTYQKMGANRAAALVYKRLLNKRRLSVRKRWNYFWNTYLAKDYTTAEQMLKKRSWLSLKDPSRPMAKLYWHARILEQAGDQKQADKLYQKLLNSDGTGYYANLTLAKHPSLWEKNSPKIVTDLSNYNNMKKITVNLATNNVQNDLSTVQDLFRAGLSQDAKSKLKQIQPRKLDSASEMATAKDLAVKLSDFYSYHRLGLQKIANFSPLPKKLSSIIEHQKNFPEKWQTMYPLAFDNVLEAFSNNLDISKYLILSVMRAESRYNNYAQSWVGARGLMQIMPATALHISERMKHTNFDITKLYEPSLNLGYAFFYLKKLLRYYQGNIFLAVAAYNAGPKATNIWLERCKKCSTDEFVETISYRETRRYVKEVIGYFGTYTKLYQNTPAFTELPKIPENLDKSEELF